MSFRQLIAKRWPIGLLDLIGHGFLAWLLPGHWWYQFYPDLMLPVILVRSLYSNSLLLENDECLEVHRMLHRVYPMLAFFVGYLVTGNILVLDISGQWLAHLILDKFTHPERVFRKSLL